MHLKKIRMTLTNCKRLIHFNAKAHSEYSEMDELRQCISKFSQLWNIITNSTALTINGHRQRVWMTTVF